MRDDENDVETDVFKTRKIKMYCIFFLSSRNPFIMVNQNQKIYTGYWACVHVYYVYINMCLLNVSHITYLRYACNAHNYNKGEYNNVGEYQLGRYTYNYTNRFKIHSGIFCILHMNKTQTTVNLATS